jgi:regulator of nucleoside diphosphate kinase
MLARPEDLKPTIRVADADYDRLANLARISDTEGGALLGRELERARVVSETQAADEPAFVRLGSLVEYADLVSGRVRRVEITLPESADIDQDRLSVLSPVGAALIGLSAGDSLSWTSDDGRPRVVVVNWVGAAGERA